MPSLLHPGVFVREIPGGARSIEGVPTSTTIFVGEAERGPLAVTPINGRTEYQRLFGGYRRRPAGVGVEAADSSRLLMPYALDGFFSNGGTSAYILRLCDGFNVIDADTTSVALRQEPGGGAEFVEASSPGTWGNSVSVAAALSTDATAASDRNRFRLAVFYTPPGSSTRVLVEEFDRLSVDDPLDENFVVDVLRRSNYIRWRQGVAPFVPANLDNVDITPRFPTAAELSGSAQLLAGGAGGDGDFDAADLPVFLTDRLQEVDDASLMVAASSRLLPEAAIGNADFVNFENHFVTFVDNRPLRDLFFIGDLPSLREQGSVGLAVREAATLAGGTLTSTEYNAVYWPHIEVADPAGTGRNPALMIPPAGHIAGVYARTDGRRGVWKAPGGLEAQLNGAQGAEFEVLDIHQDTLNPRAVNALRQVPAGPTRPLVIWGVRTRRPTTEWRYIPVRRTAIFLRISIYQNIQWAVFEPNDYRLWQTLRNTIGAFMEIQFRNGAFAGETSREAYFVKVDAETTTPDDQAAGIVNILVGFAPLRPAEFVVVSLQQMAGRQR